YLATPVGVCYRARRIIARIPVRIASGKLVQASNAAANSGSKGTLLAPSAPDSAPPPIAPCGFGKSSSGSTPMGYSKANRTDGQLDCRLLWLAFQPGFSGPFCWRWLQFANHRN